MLYLLMVWLHLAAGVNVCAFLRPTLVQVVHLEQIEHCNRQVHCLPYSEQWWSASFGNFKNLNLGSTKVALLRISSFGPV